jgi:hypothetical protein
MTAATQDGAGNTPPFADQKEMNAVTDTTPKAEDAEDGSFEDYHIDPVAETKMMRKFDYFAVIPMGFLYFMSNINRSNLGNANIAGMPEEIGLVGNQFGIATTLLHVLVCSVWACD